MGDVNNCIAPVNKNADTNNSLNFVIGKIPIRVRNECFVNMLPRVIRAGIKMNNALNIFMIYFLSNYFNLCSQITSSQYSRTEMGQLQNFTC